MSSTRRWSRVDGWLGPDDAAEEGSDSVIGMSAGVPTIVVVDDAPVG